MLLVKTAAMPTPDSPPTMENCHQRPLFDRRNWALAISAVCCGAVSVCNWTQPDWLAAVTLVPAWCWLVPGLALTVYGMNRTHKLRCISVAILWVGYAGLFVEEIHSLVRTGSRPTAEWQVARERGRAIRVVSLNCYVANPRSAAEVAQFEPDIVLLQESPSREHLQHLAREVFGDGGSFLWGGDTSILANGRIQPGTVDPSSHFVHATVELPGGVELDVISVRLHPPVFRLDFWDSGFWIDHRNNRVKHRDQILDVMQVVAGIPQSAHLIVGGDFNAPPLDAALSPLRQRLFDTFTEAGRGWGNTGTNDYPLFRVDQIWATRSATAETVTAQKTIHSDHRMVVCDLVLTE
jgi:endonuclease/exonuclease/phosphatase family metal-dependent hydrolase